MLYRPLFPSLWFLSEPAMHWNELKAICPRNIIFDSRGKKTNVKGTRIICRDVYVNCSRQFSRKTAHSTIECHWRLVCNDLEIIRRTTESEWNRDSKFYPMFHGKVHRLIGSVHESLSTAYCIIVRKPSPSGHVRWHPVTIAVNLTERGETAR